MESKYYFNDSLCKRNHLCARRTSDSKCHYCVRERNSLRSVRYRAQIRSGEHEVKPRNSSQSHGKSRSLEMWIYKTAKQRARAKGLPFAIDVNDIIIPDACPILGIKIDKTWGGVAENSESRANKPSLDRIDSFKGYIKGNIAVISYKANLIKQDANAMQHRQIADYIRREYALRGWHSD